LRLRAAPAVVLRLALVRRLRVRLEAARGPARLRGGTFLPLRRASASPMAIACLRLVTVFLLRPERSVPRLRLRMARSTSFDALGEYFRAMGHLPADNALQPIPIPCARFGMARARDFG
jgi:hypothetical protein